MFTTVLGNLTSLLPKNLVFGSFVPVVIFGFLNGALLYFSSAAFRDVAGPAFSAAPVLATTVLFVAAVVVAYVFSSLQNVMRLTLEGAYTPGWMAAEPRAREAARKKRLTDARDVSREDARALADANANAMHTQMRDAVDAQGPRKPGYEADQQPLRAAIAEFAARVSRWAPVHADELQDAVTKMAGALGTYDPAGQAIAADRKALADVIQFARQEAPDRARACFAQRETDFGNDLPSSTRLGNIAGSLASYTLDRYNFDIDTFWSRLQLVLQAKDAGSYGALIDAKTQLDFLVSCWWFTVATAFTWSLLFAFVGDAWLAAIVTAPIGAAVAAAIYRLAATAYASYADVVRACVDLNRFALLRAMHVPLPAGIREERALWPALTRITSFGSQIVEMNYQHEGTS